MAAGGMRKSKLFRPRHSVSTAAEQPGKRRSAPLKLLEVTGRRETERQVHRERQREGRRGPSLARGHSCEEQMGGRSGEREAKRDRLVGAE